ncbi:TetR family transcriptional regulator [Rhizobium sp. Root274]|nr:TetR family transcriptional regulator [Rhizobium sp. Root1240]KRD26413.1 TetR family transcriptional regulator [Rhizobium sp. Root274]
MTSRGRGRPPAAGKTVSPGQILAEALAILETDGLEALTMRALAGRAGINPMTIYHHFDDRDGLIRALAELAYSELAAPETGNALERAHSLIRAYYATVVRFPDLTLAIFARSCLFPERARRITDEIRDLLAEHGLSSQKSVQWTHILVDYTHGAALAAAPHSKTESGQPATEAGLTDFNIGLAELFETIRRASIA